MALQWAIIVLQAFVVLVLIGAANTAPLVLKKWLGSRFAWPMDGGRHWFDGRPILGHSKTVRGLAAGVLVPALLAPLLGHAWQHGAAVGAAAMTGDLLSSFCKRRLNRPPSSQVFGLDQIPEVLLPLWLGRTWFELSAFDVAVLLIAFVALQLVLSRLFFRLKLRDEPY